MSGKIQTEMMHNSDFVEAVTVQSSGRGGGEKMQLVEIKCCLICLLTAGEKAERWWSCCTFLLRFALAVGTFAGTLAHQAVDAQLVILGGRQREGSPLLAAPRGGKRVAGSRGSLSSCFHCLEEARGSESRLPVTQNYLPECDCACWEGTLKTVTPLLMCAIYSCRLLLRARLCFSRFNIHLLRVNTVATFSREADTRNLSVSL